MDRTAGVSRRAAVLVPLWREGDGGVSLLLIQRAAEGLHAGQMALPGGRHDPTVDSSLVATALRESEEEVGLSARDVAIFGALSERRTYTSQFLVTPFVAWIPAGYPFVAQRREVADMVRVPLAVFQDPSRRVSLRKEFRAERVVVAGVDLGERVVWGLTLDIIDEVLRSDLLAAVPS